MPLPFIVGGIAAIAGIAGIGSGISGAAKMIDANDTMKSAQNRHEKNLKKYEQTNKKATASMDELGGLELKIMKSFKDFSDVIDQIQNKPEFKAICKNGVNLNRYSADELKRTSVGAGVLLGSLSGAALGGLGGVAAAGATTSAVAMLGTASTGTAISSLSGAAATNATLAALGGGSLAAGGGGMALGSAILGGATFGIGLLVGGAIFNAAGSNLSEKADEAYSQMKTAEREINKVCGFLDELKNCADSYYETLDAVNNKYKKYLQDLKSIVYTCRKTNWDLFNDRERLVAENCYYLVLILYNMCKVNFLLKSDKENEMNKINYTAINKASADAEKILQEIA